MCGLVNANHNIQRRKNGDCSCQGAKSCHPEHWAENVRVVTRFEDLLASYGWDMEDAGEHLYNGLQ